MIRRRFTVADAIDFLWSHAEVSHCRRDGVGDEIERECLVTHAKVLYLDNPPPAFAREHFAYQVTRALQSRADLAERIYAAMVAAEMAVAS